jgi:Tol biopolymer transport system component
MIAPRYVPLAILISLFAPATLTAQETSEQALRRIYSLKADGTDLLLLAELPDSLAVNSPDVSPDGKLILISSWDDEEGETRQNSRIARLNLVAGKLASPLQFELGDGAMPSWSPRGKRIAFTRFSLSRGVWIMKNDGTRKVVLDSRGTNAKWSPNGHMIAYSKSVRGGRTIAIYDMVEDRSFDLWENSGSPFESIADSFAWSPDSKQLCLRARRPTEDTGADDQDYSEIVTVRIHDSAKPTTHETCEDGHLPTIAWHPDGKRIVFSKLANDGKLTQLYWFAPATGDASQPLPGQDATRDNSGACWTRDGSRLIFVSTAAAEDPEEIASESQNADRN